MYNGDRARKETLVQYGFRLPAAVDNRPLREEEFIENIGQAVFVSATPTERELSLSDNVAEQVIRPTGLVDPRIVVKPSAGQIDDLLYAVKERAAKNERTLVTTLTKKMAELDSELSATTIAEIIAAEDRERAGENVPPAGLYFMHGGYEAWQPGAVQQVVRDIVW